MRPNEIKYMVILALTLLIFRDGLCQRDTSLLRDVRRMMKSVETYNSLNDLPEWRAEVMEKMNREQLVIWFDTTQSAITFSDGRDRIGIAIDERKKMRGLVNTVAMSPKGDYFVMYFDGEVPSRYIYVASAKGEIVAEVAIEAYPRVSFSESGKFFIIHNGFGNNFGVYDRYGYAVMEGDYTQITFTTSILYGVFISEDDSTVMLSTGTHIYKINLNKQIQWSTTSNIVNKCKFGDIIITETWAKSPTASKEMGIYDIIFLDKKLGQQVAEVKQISRSVFLPEIVVIQKNNEHHVVKIK